MGFIEESAEWKTFSLEKNRYNAQALLSVVADNLLTEDKWRNQSVVRQIAAQRYSLANDELKIGNIYYCTMDTTNLVLIIYDVKDDRGGDVSERRIWYVYKWKSFRNGMVNTDTGSTRIVGEKDRRSPHSNIFKSKRWVSVYSESYQFINWTDNPFEVKS
jgi:hypothetical protein